MIKEFNFLRTFACLSIVLLHVTTHYGRAMGHPDSDPYFIARVLLCFATPAFIVLSIMILANRYHSRIPEGFFKKRLLLIGLPFVFFAIVDGFVAAHFSANVDLLLKIQNNILYGTFVGWFILVILQLYVLHVAVVKLSISMKWFLPFGLIVMFSYLYVLKENPVVLTQFVDRPHLLFPAWLGYFAVAFAIGKHYQKVMQFCRQYWWLLLLVTIGSGALVAYNYLNGYTSISSRRLDLVPFTVFASLLILLTGQFIRRYSFINFIGGYAFAIYLLHWQVIRFLMPEVVSWDLHPVLHVAVAVILTVAICILIVRTLGLIPLSKYLVGNIPKSIMPSMLTRFRGPKQAAG